MIVSLVPPDNCSHAVVIPPNQLPNSSIAPLIPNILLRSVPISPANCLIELNMFTIPLLMPLDTGPIACISSVMPLINCSALIPASRNPSAVDVPNAFCIDLDKDGKASFITFKSEVSILPLLIICPICSVTLSNVSGLPPDAAIALPKLSIVTRARFASIPTPCKRKDALTACSKSIPGFFPTSLNFSNSIRACPALYPALPIVVSKDSRNSSMSPAALIAATPMPKIGAVIPSIILLPIEDRFEDVC